MISGSDCFSSCSKRSGERVYIRAFARIIGESAQSGITSLATMPAHGSLADSAVAGATAGAGIAGSALTTAGVGGGLDGLEGWDAQAASTIEIASVRLRRMQVLARGVVMPGSDPWPA